ncbi:MAG: SGNH/GDSL hydrolase family protein [Lachnospiraceae bacterium]|nr:SGNH/GDSL hydrolase family protein [Lachnospiraceae bacterium]
MNSAMYILLLALMAEIQGGVDQYEANQQYTLPRADYERLTTEDYNAVFFSTFPIDHYMAEDYASYDASYPLMTSYCIPNMNVLNEYFTNVSNSSNEVNTVYLGVRPDIITADDLLNLMDTWADIRFEVIMAYPSLDYWRGLDEEEYLAAMAAYTDFVNTLMSCYEDLEGLPDNLSVYFYNSTEWLVGNNTNYESNFDVNEGISHSLSLYSSQDYGYQLTLENYKDTLNDFEVLVNDCRTETESVYPNLSEWDVVFFGDSVIAFSETSSIPGAFSGLTGAHTYNCGKGGCAATVLEGNYEYPGLPIVVDAFLAEDLSLFSEGTQIYAGMADYFEHSDISRHQCFVLNFGLNDYFLGRPIRSDDPYDIYTYEGALRTAIEKLQNAYPDAEIILLSPTFTSHFENGLQPLSDVGGQLPDYVAAAISICDEKGLYYYDSYNLLGIDANNCATYLPDGCHPNEATRYIMAQEIAKLIGSITDL